MQKRKKLTLALTILALLAIPLYVLIYRCLWRVPLTAGEETWCTQFDLQLPGGSYTLDTILSYCDTKSVEETKVGTSATLALDRLAPFLPAQAQNLEGDLNTNQETGERSVFLSYYVPQGWMVTLLCFEPSTQYLIGNPDEGFYCVGTFGESGERWVNFYHNWFTPGSSLPPLLPAWMSFFYPSPHIYG